MFNHHLWTAIITPMSGDGSIDYSTFEKLLKRQEYSDNGIVILGSTGEALALSLSERKEVVTFASKLNLKVSLMVGVGGSNLEEQKSWIKFCESFNNVDSFLMPCPLYSKPGIEGQALWFKELLDTTTKPSMLYNVPSRTGIKLFQEVIERLSDHKNFWSLKEASGSLDELEKYQKVCKDIEIFSGEDGLIVDQAKYGIKGLVSVAANIWPSETSLYVKRALEGESDNLKEIWSPVIDTLFMQSNPIPAKVLMHMNKIIPSATLRLPLTTLEIKETSLLSNSDKVITQWFQKEINEH